MSTGYTVPDELLQRLGLTLLPEATRNRMLYDIGSTIYQVVMMRAWGVLNERQREEVRVLMKGSGPEPAEAQEWYGQVNAFLEENVAGYDVMIAEEWRSFLANQHDKYIRIISGK